MVSLDRRSALLNAIENMAGSYEHMLTTRSEERGLKMKAFSRVSLGSSQSLSDRSVATPHSRDATGTSTSAGTGAGAGAGAGSGSGAGLSSPGSQSKSSDKGKGNEFTATDGLSGLMEVRRVRTERGGTGSDMMTVLCEHRACLPRRRTSC